MSTDLLPCTERISVRSNVLCCNESRVCVEFDGLSIGDMARYSTSSDYCIETQLVRMCTEGEGWDGKSIHKCKPELQTIHNKSTFINVLHMYIIHAEKRMLSFITSRG